MTKRALWIGCLIALGFWKMQIYGPLAAMYLCAPLHDPRFT